MRDQNRAFKNEKHHNKVAIMMISALMSQFYRILDLICKWCGGRKRRMFRKLYKLWYNLKHERTAQKT